MSDWIFDVDGTLMDASHRAHHLEPPKDWDAYFAKIKDDKPIEHIFEIGRALARNGDRLICASARPAKYQPVTIWQLRVHGFPLSGLYMRLDGDRRDDDIIKIEMLARIRADGYNPIAVFDDRDRVVAAWRAAGLPCLQVAPGAF